MWHVFRFWKSNMNKIKKRTKGNDVLAGPPGLLFGLCLLLMLAGGFLVRII